MRLGVEFIRQAAEFLNPGPESMIAKGFGFRVYPLIKEQNSCLTSYSETSL